MQSLCVLGRQPALGRAELESLFGADKLRRVGDGAVLLDIEPHKVPFARLGGTIKLCKVIATIPSVELRQIHKHLTEAAPRHAKILPEGKLKVGISAYGFKLKPKQLHAFGLELKQVIKSSGRSVRIIPNKESALNSAQVLHNQLTGKLGWELILAKDGGQTVLAQTVNVQDIEAYAARDQARPKRDARVGMLPPKLAQIIINLARGNIEELGERREERGEAPLATPPLSTLHTPNFAILDPFCGTGVILQETLLMGFKAYGTDLDPRMVQYSEENLAWISQKNAIAQKSKVKLGDATEFSWLEDFNLNVADSAIATETYLGRPFSALPKPEVLDDVTKNVNTIIKKFLQNVARQTPPGFRLCLAVPAWRINSTLRFKHLKVLETLPELGYTRQSFVHTRHEDLIYHREGQIVARELVVLVRS